MTCIDFSRLAHIFIVGTPLFYQHLQPTLCSHCESSGTRPSGPSNFLAALVRLSPSSSSPTLRDDPPDINFQGMSTRPGKRLHTK